MTGFLAEVLRRLNLVQAAQVHALLHPAPRHPPSPRPSSTKEQPMTETHRPPCIDGDHCGELHCPPPPRRRRLTEAEHAQAWHAIDDLEWQAFPNADTVLNAVLTALGIDPPAGPTVREKPDDALCGYCGAPKSSHRALHPWTSTTDAIANDPRAAEGVGA